MIKNVDLTSCLVTLLQNNNIIVIFEYIGAYARDGSPMFRLSYRQQHNNILYVRIFYYFVIVWNNVKQTKRLTYIILNKYNLTFSLVTIINYGNIQ